MLLNEYDCILLDLDDTLYPEVAFVYSGLRAVAQYLAAKVDETEAQLYAQLVEYLEQDGRGKIFNAILRRYNLETPLNVRALIYLYRTHTPALSFYPDTVDFLVTARKRGHKLGIITDGKASVQWRKIQALAVEPYVDMVICTDDLGKSCWKPSDVPYRYALQTLNCAPQRAMYVGDNPAKDFLAPNQLQMLSVHITRSGPVRVGFPATTPIPTDPLYQAATQVPTLAALLTL